MNGVIDTLKFTDSNGEINNLYPRTLIECVSNKNGDTLEDTVKQLIAESVVDPDGENLATKDYVDEQIADLINGAPTTLDTLGEIATAMAENKDVVEALDAAIGNKANASDLANYLPLNGSVPMSGGFDFIDRWGSIGGDENHANLIAYGSNTNKSNFRSIRILNSKYSPHEMHALSYYIFKDGVGSDYPILHTGNVGDYALPLDGSTSMTGALTAKGLVKAYSAFQEIALHSSDVQASGAGLWSTTHSKWLSNIDQNGNIVHYGTATGNLPLSGGTLSGGECVLSLQSNTADSYMYFKTVDGNRTTAGYYNGLSFISNETSLARIGVDNSGTPQYWTHWNGNTKYNLLHTGNYTDYALPLSGGGTVKKDNATPLAIENSNANGSTTFIRYIANKNGTLGYLGFNGVNSPVFEIAELGTQYPLLHTGNVGSYALTKDGGALNATKSLSFKPASDGGSAVGNYFINPSDGAVYGGVGAVAYNGNCTGIYLSASTTPWDATTGLHVTPNSLTWKNNPVHHDGNSAKVAIQSSAPSDTSALWVW